MHKILCTLTIYNLFIRSTNWRFLYW